MRLTVLRLVRLKKSNYINRNSRPLTLNNQFVQDFSDALKLSAQNALRSSEEFAIDEEPKSKEEIIDDWLFVKDSNFIKEYWR